jgi:hypothetical protein
MARGMPITLTICTCRVAEELESIIAAVHGGTLDPTTIDFQALADRLVESMDISFGDGSDEDEQDCASEDDETEERIIN